MIVRHDNRQNKHLVGKYNRLTREVMRCAEDIFLSGFTFKGKAVIPHVSVTWAGPRVMRRLNRETRQLDRLTDVLSFPLLMFKEGKLEKQLALTDFDLTRLPDYVLPLGDLVISIDQALSQAIDFGHTAEREIAFLTAHGLLHLIGYDHQTNEQEIRMRAKQRLLLEMLGIDREAGPD